MPILITQLTLDVGYVILSTTGLSFLGLGAQPPAPEWGAMIMSARQFMRESWWYTNLIQNQRNRQKIVDTFHRYELPTRNRQPSC